MSLNDLVDRDDADSTSITTIITLTPQLATPLAPGSHSAISSSTSKLVSSSSTIATPSATPTSTATDTDFPIPLQATASSTKVPVPAPVDTSSSTPHKQSNVPLIAGVTCAIVAASIISVLVWFYWRRRVQKRTRFASISSFGPGEGKERHDSYYEGQHLNKNSYGGYGAGNSPEPQADTQQSRSLLLAADKGHSPNDQQETRSLGGHLSGRQQPDYDSLPSQISPEVSIFPLPTPIVPRTPGTPPTPIHSSQQRQHPAYHLHQLSRHPAFRPGGSPPRDQPPLWRHPAFRPEGETPQLDSIPIVPQNELDAGPSSTRSELPGQSPSFPSQSRSEPDMLSRFTAKPSQRSSKSRESISRGGSGKTGVSTYSIPIGLGLEGSNNPFALPMQRHNTPPPTSPKAPMRSNMNERDDHIMSWSAYGAGNLSGIGPSNSTGSERTRRQREIEQATVREATSPGSVFNQRWIQRWSDRMDLPPRRVHSAWSEMPETPLSAVYRESWTERESWARR